VTAQNAMGPQMHSEALRRLSPLERLFDAIDQTNGFNFSIAVTFRGNVAHSGWVAAFAQVQQRHPFLRASLNRDDLQAPYVQRSESSLIPLTFERRTSSTQWQSVMEAQGEEPFAASAAPLVRVNILEDDRGCDLIVTAHHAILDGMGALLLIRDVLAVLSGERLAPLAMPLAAEDRIEEARSSAPPQSIMDPQAAEAWQQFLATRPPRSFERHAGTRRPIISSLRLSPEETSQLLRSARKQQTTLGAVLLTALTAAVRELNASLTKSDIRFSIPVDARPYLKNDDDFVLSISLPQGVCLYPGTDFWENARTLRLQLTAFQSLDGIEAYFGAIRVAMDQNLDATTLIDVVAKHHGVDITLTNMKHVTFPMIIDGMTVEAVWGPSVSSCIAGCLVLGSATFNGALHLVYTTYTPLPELLGKLQEILRKACSDA
jgi:Condensation domain